MDQRLRAALKLTIMAVRPLVSHCKLPHSHAHHMLSLVPTTRTPQQQQILPVNSTVSLSAQQQAHVTQAFYQTHSTPYQRPNTRAESGGQSVTALNLSLLATSAKMIILDRLDSVGFYHVSIDP
ncbi:hypothetical protein Q3G72_017106 [Acer saccharum]|nr:hypothetical protein Q3G72_017106 [Acer saccharum]